MPDPYPVVDLSAPLPKRRTAPPKAKYDAQAEATGRKVLEQMKGLGRQAVAGAQDFSRQANLPAAMTAAGRRATEPLRRADAYLRNQGAKAEAGIQRFGADMREGARMMGQGFAGAARDIGGVLSRVNRGPQGDTWATFNQPGQAGAAQASIPPTQPQVQKPATPKERNPATAVAGGDVPGLPKPGQAGTTGTQTRPAPTGNRYLDIYNAGPEAQAKAIKDANLVHLIRGTKQTWANPKIQGGMGAKEFGSALEAATGTDEINALLRAKNQRQLEKARIERQPKRQPFEVKTVTEMGPDGLPMEISKVFNPNTGQFVDNAADQDQAVVSGLQAGSISEDQFKAYYSNASAAQRKRLQQLIAGFQNK